MLYNYYYFSTTKGEDLKQVKKETSQKSSSLPSSTKTNQSNSKLGEKDNSEVDNSRMYSSSCTKGKVITFFKFFYVYTFVVLSCVTFTLSFLGLLEEACCQF